ncbi:MAG TPA: hypothetical protein VMP01_19485 [Pirellulaceae bacterium]|nr:hypothetical protein [Pirellulaceae bacterium]
MADEIGFIVEYVVSDNEGYFHAVGRCGENPIHVGDQFHRIYAPAVIVRSSYQGLGEVSPVKLRVERIQAYQHQLEKLGQGMTGTIDLRGDGLNRVIPGAVLGVPSRGDGAEQAFPEAIPQENRIT